MEQFTEFFCFKLGSAARKLKKYYDNKLAPYGVTIAQSFIILSLLERDGQSVKGLARRLEIESSAITGLVDRLEKEHLVERQVDQNDRRAFCIHLTKRGRELGDSMLPIAVQFNQDIKSGLSKTELSALSKLFEKIDEINN